MEPDEPCTCVYVGLYKVRGRKDENFDSQLV